MSKGTVRYPESAIAGGRVGTARIHSQIAGAAARLASDEHVPLDAAIARMVDMPRGVKTDISNFPNIEISNTRGVLQEAPHTAASATHRANAALGDKPAPGKRETPHADLTPLQRMQALGRLPRGRMNKTEAAYVIEQLDPQLHAGEILFYRFEAIKLRLADNTFLTVDFPVITAAGELEFREVKGRWTDDARAKIKVAAAQFPWRFFAIHRDGRHGWRTEDLTSRSW
ncbi:hypothetical protein [Caballeronia sp. dw_19]|uniref:hypothetical protein n=1 Tax=Caballeronia sp. dw_19 TaxID=2719791 RepID=UPI002106D211|nr:hypothetical protein [Caballeronia sp. dw_19]